MSFEPNRARTIIKGMKTKEQIEKIVKGSFSYSDVARSLYGFVNGTSLRKVRKVISEFSLDASHFDGGRMSRFRYKPIEKTCPVCGKTFQERKGHPKERTTCSRACSNTFFRSGKNNPNWKDSKYRSTCFAYHEKKCIICEEEKIVAVHHYEAGS